MLSDQRKKDYSVEFTSNDELLSIDWVQKLLGVFICCHEEFRTILLNNKEQVSKPPLDRLISEFFEKSVKALDICNASRDGVEKIRTWQKHLDIVLSALGSNKRALNEGQFRRARKALMDLALAMLEEKDSGSVFSQHLVDSPQFPLTEDQEMEIEQDMKELTHVCEAFRVGLDPLERQVREAFRKIMTCQTEGLDYLGSSSYADQ
ncbi:hypothetical protein AHAS_Ahas07G0153000 [Arachis hypogaea]